MKLSSLHSNTSTISNRGIISALLALIVIATASCSMNTEEESNTASSAVIRSEMRDVYGAAQNLFSYVWDDTAFTDKQNREKIKSLLSRLSQDFHNVAATDAAKDREPGFDIILKTQQTMLSDISRRYAEGKYEYARWRLQGVLENCNTCHSRLPVTLDFSAPALSLESATPEQRFRRAQMLLSSRQYDTAAQEFYQLALDFSQAANTSTLAISAIKQWLMIQVRVKTDWTESAAALDDILDQPGFSETQLIVLSTWVQELKTLAKEPQPTTPSIEGIQELLAPVVLVDSIPEQEKYLVNTLRASGLLHELLAGSLSTEDRRNALLWLGVSYSKLPIRSLASYARLYFERCIREYPKSKEAKEAYTRYREILLLESSGSSGLHLEDEDTELLHELRSLAGVSS